MWCLDIILGVSVRVFLDEINIGISRLKQIAHSNTGGPHPIENLNTTKRLRKKELPSDCLG